MVDERQPDTDHASGGEAVTGPGERLREAREEAGLSRQDLADRLHLNVSIVGHLEEDRFDDLPEPAYVRGYLRAAARALNLDVEPLIRAFDAQGPSEPRLDTPPVVGWASVNASGRGSRKSPYILGAVILAVVVGLIAYGWYETRSVVSTPERIAADRIGGEDRPRTTVPLAEPPPPPAATEDTEPAPSLTTPDPGTTPPEARAEALPEVPSPAVGERDLPPEFPAEAPPAPPVTEPAPQLPEQPREPVLPADTGAQSATEPEGGNVLDAPPESDALVITFVEDSWVEIHDANDQSLLVGLMREGSERHLTGAAPYRVFLGNAPGVRMRINDQSYDPSRHARSDNTARFVLDRP